MYLSTQFHNTDTVRSEVNTPDAAAQIYYFMQIAPMELNAFPGVKLCKTATRNPFLKFRMSKNKNSKNLNTDFRTECHCMKL